jgi:hypothetical protein
MGTVGPHFRTIPVRCAPAKAPCPTCGKLGRRKATHNRLVRTIASKRVVYRDVTYGEYRARRACCTTFRTTPPGVEPRALDDETVRRAVLDRILDDGMSVERVIASMRRDFLLDLSDGFVSDCLDWQARRLDLADHRRRVSDRFSGTLCADELHLGRTTLLLATDPLQDLPVALALVAANDRDHMRRSLKTLKAWGLSPEVVVSDGSNLDPAILAELGPNSRHQLCVFHVLKELQAHPAEAYFELKGGGHTGLFWSCVERLQGRRPACPPASCTTPSGCAATRTSAPSTSAERSTSPSASPARRCGARPAGPGTFGRMARSSGGSAPCPSAPSPCSSCSPSPVSPARAAG